MGEVAHFGSDDGVSERPLPLASSRDLSRSARSPSLRSRVVAPPARFFVRPLSLCSLGLAVAADGRACVGSLRELEGAFGSAIITAELR